MSAAAVWLGSRAANALDYTAPRGLKVRGRFTNNGSPPGWFTMKPPRLAQLCCHRIHQSGSCCTPFRSRACCWTARCSAPRRSSTSRAPTCSWVRGHRLCLQPPCMHADSCPLRAVCLPAVGSRGAVHPRWSSAGTPELIAAALQPPDAVEAAQHVDVVAVDEVDACFQVPGWLCFGVL